MMVWIVCLILYIVAVTAQLGVAPVNPQLARGSWIVGFGLLLLACRVRGL